MLSRLILEVRSPTVHHLGAKLPSETILATLNTKEASPPHHHFNQAAETQSVKRSTNTRKNIPPSKSLSRKSFYIYVS
ncbi:hypothetical protein BDR22DRAFT_464372 [Usnea florida]